ncbi:MAG: GDSL-type esterase/lipase family protein [Deltaproteobacteria bacterium]|nr:GDSL-type esterase/lipase family protein [Deltaproteobacteria bacterium]
MKKAREQDCMSNYFRSKIWIERLTILLISILIFFVLGEILIRLLVHTEPPLPFQKLPDSPRLVGLIPGFEREDIKINSRGFRDGEYPEEKSRNTLRIVGLGDSFTFGAGVKLQDTYLKQLEKMLTEKSSFKTVEILNMGVPGYNTYQELIFMKEVGLRYKPDIVIVGFVLNDVDLLDRDLLASSGKEKSRQLVEQTGGEKPASSIMKCNTWESRKENAILSVYGKELQAPDIGRARQNDGDVV